MSGQPLGASSCKLFRINQLRIVLPWNAAAMLAGTLAKQPIRLTYGAYPRSLAPGSRAREQLFSLLGVLPDGAAKV